MGLKFFFYITFLQLDSHMFQLPYDHLRPKTMKLAIVNMRIKIKIPINVLRISFHEKISITITKFKFLIFINLYENAAELGKAKIKMCFDCDL